MNRSLSHPLVLCTSLLSLLTAAAPVARAQWTAPTEEELKMTSQPEVPGAPAVYLFREEIIDDKNGTWSVYVRLKVLTELGKEFATIELNQYQGEYAVKDVAGRTIHPDGAIIPFTGKPFERLIEKGRDFKEVAKVFTLPDVQVGSILEYRYTLRLVYEDNTFIPSWFVQSKLFTAKAHYLWKENLVDAGFGPPKNISWTPILPRGAEVKQVYLSGQTGLELNVHDIPPVPDEDYMPPIESLSYRVLFYYSSYRTPDEFWKGQGKLWAQGRNDFIGPGSKVRAAVKQLVSSSDTPDQKLRKIYAEVMTFDNTAFDRQTSAAEEKAHKFNKVETTDDIWEHKRGSDDQIAALFIAMARAAGMKAYAMDVSNRDHNVFLPNFLSFSQLDDTIAIVEVDGKEQFFDPGQRYCPYGHLAWKHTTVRGLRQMEGGSELATTPDEPYTASKTQRTAELTLDEHGAVAGALTFTWTGAPALSWRQRSLRNDTTGLENDLRVAVEDLLPAGTEVKVEGIEALQEYEKPLTVRYRIKGDLASSTGKRLLVPADLFEINAKPAFPHEKRTLPIYFNYPYLTQDTMHISFPANLGVESLPTAEKLPFENLAVYSLTSEAAPTGITVRRGFILGSILFTLAEYPSLRAFYTKFETKDQEPIVFTTAPAKAAGN